MANDYTPTNSETTLYIYMGMYGNNKLNMDDLMWQAMNHFGDYIEWDALDIEIEHVHTRCIGYDQYDSSDWDYYLSITRK